MVLNGEQRMRACPRRPQVVAEFQSKTPARFKVTAVRSAAKSAAPAGLTEPREPLLSTAARQRPARFKPVRSGCAIVALL